MSKSSSAPDRELAGRRAADQEGLEISGGVETALGKRDQGAGELRPARGEGERFEAAVVGQRRDAGRRRDDARAGADAELGKIESDDAIDPLDADIERAVLIGERLGVIPAARREGAAVGAEQRRHLGVGDADRTLALIDDAAGEPISLVGQRDEMGAVGGHAQRREAAELLVRRGQLEAAAKFQRAEADLAGLARQKGIDRFRVDRDRDRAVVVGAFGGERRDERERVERDSGCGARGRPCTHGQRGAARQRGDHECRRRVGRRAGSGGGISSNSSASFSIMTPPSSSASTMVTARR